MGEVVWTATVLLCAVLLIRRLLRGRIPAGAVYALWLLVALRLLVPVSVGESRVSAGNLLRERPAVTVQPADPQMGLPVDNEPILENQPGGESVDVPPIQPAEPAERTPQQPEIFPAQKAEPANPAPPSQREGRPDAPTFAPAPGRVNWGSVLRAAWAVGAAATALWFVTANLRLEIRLRRARRAYPVEGCPAPVYRADFLASPCLVGVFRPAIYLNKAAAEHPERLKYILTHELCHKRHGDNAWALARSVCLCLWWFHPLVWAAAVCSKRDCELFCDAAAVKRLGEAERVPYGETLLSMVAAGRAGPGALFCASTAMTEGKKQIKERVIRVSKRQKVKKAALALTLVLALLAGLCTFTGAVEPSAGTAVPYHVERQEGLTAENLEVTDDVSIPDFDWVGTEAGYSKEVAMRFMAEYGKRLYGLPNGSPWKAADVAVLGGDYEWTHLSQVPGDWGLEPYRKGTVRQVWGTAALAVKPVGGLDPVRALYNGGLPRGTGDYEDYALMELLCSLTLEDGRWYAHGNREYSLALRANTTPPGEPQDWTDEQIKRWSLDYRMPVAVTGDDRAAWEEAGRLWAENYIRQHLTAPENGTPAKADDARLTTMELQGWSPSEKPEALYFHLEYTFRPVWGTGVGVRFINQMGDRYVGASWTEDGEYATVTAAVTLRRDGTENGKMLWSGYEYHGEYAQNYANGMDLPSSISVLEAAGEPVAKIDPVGVSVTFPAGTDETKQRYAVFGLWAAEFGQQFYRLPKNDALYCAGVEIDYAPHVTPTLLTSSGSTRVNMGVTDDVGLFLRPANGQKEAAAALGSDRTYVYEKGTNGRDQYDGKISTDWHITLERTYNADGSVTWTCTQGRVAQSSDYDEPATIQALPLSYHVEPKRGLSMSTLDGDVIGVPNDGKGDLAARWAYQFGQQFYALPEGAAWKAADVMVYDAGDAIGLALKPVGGLKALEGQYPKGYPIATGKGELEGYALLQYDPSFRLETVNLFGNDPVWIRERGGTQWIPGPPEVGGEDWQEAMEHQWKQFMAGNYSYLNVPGNEPGDPKKAARGWAENYLDGLLGDGMWGRNGSPLQADSAKILELTQTASGTVDGEQSATFTFRYAIRPVWGMDVAQACNGRLTPGTGELAGYAVDEVTVELRFQPGRPYGEDGYGYQGESEGVWYCAECR